MARGTRTVLLTLAVLAVLTAVSVALAYSYGSWQPWLAVHTGSASGQESGGAYAYWSGFGSVFPWGMGILATLLVLIYHNLVKHNCHAKGCVRIGRYHVAGTPYVTCRKHHPAIEDNPTAQDIALAHAENCESLPLNPSPA